MQEYLFNIRSILFLINLYSVIKELEAALIIEKFIYKFLLKKRSDELKV